jgi:D,D-heptose 1,7-bisphosphate phosphatase
MTRRPAAFLDRDGTIIIDRDYPHDPDQVELIEGAADALRRLADSGYALVVITNQSGIARGYYDEAAYRAVHARMAALLAAHGVTLDGDWHCPHHPDFTGPCDCRKPGLRLFREAAETLGIDLARSVWIGDRPGDVTPALRLGGQGFLVQTGQGGQSEVPAGVEPVADLAAAATLIVGPEAAC